MWWNGFANRDLSWLPTLGPRTTGFARVAGAADQLDLFVQHDKGTDIVMPTGTPNYEAFEVHDSGTNRATTGFARVTATTIHLTLDSNLSPNSPITFDYGRWF